MALTKISGSILKDPLNLGEVSIGGTLTYQDVTNVDSIGLGTFRAGINVSGGTGTFAGDVSIADKIITLSLYLVLHPEIRKKCSNIIKILINLKFIQILK